MIDSKSVKQVDSPDCQIERRAEETVIQCTENQAVEFDGETLAGEKIKFVVLPTPMARARGDWTFAEINI